MSDELERLDRVLDTLGRVLEAPGDDGSPEWTWHKVDLMEAAMGADAFRALLRRQGVGRATIDEALEVLARRRGLSG